MIYGMDVLLSRRLKLLKGRRVGLLSHQAALVRGGATSAQAMRRTLGSSLKALFGPEHGFLGQTGAGEKTWSTVHPDWDIPVYSLYGEMRKPSDEMLAGIDVVVCDLQDIAVRCYTYLATLLNMYDACRENGVDLIVTDRPVPLPHVVDGPMLEPRFRSFVAPCSLPMVYGMTPAETVAWLSSVDETGFEPVVVPMSGWKRERSLIYGYQGDFMPPSPALKSREAALVYPALVFSEALPGIDCGRGINMTFRVFGAPWLEGKKFCTRLNSLQLDGVVFHPHCYTAAAGCWKGRKINGVRLSISDPAMFRPVECSLHIIRELTDCFGDARIWCCKGVRQRWFDKLYGGSETRLALKKGESLREIFKRWKKDNAPFMAERERVLLYR
ncbi:MAG: DUF1343 domain-containing protein [Kiritimatiellia bacterium]